jgi:subtilisin family serine protease
MAVLTAVLLLTFPSAGLAVPTEEPAQTAPSWGDVPLYADPSAYAGSAEGPVKIDDFITVGPSEPSLNDVAAGTTETDVPYVEGEVLVVLSHEAGSGSGLASLQSVDGVEPVDAGTDVALVTLDEGVTVEQAVDTLADAPGVVAAQPNYIYALAGATIPNDFYFDYQWGMHNTGQVVGGVAGADIDGPEAWAVEKGSDRTIVAVIDSGIDVNHPDLARNLWTNRREIPGNGLDDDGNGYVDDIHGYDFESNTGSLAARGEHGTHVSGIIGAEANSGYGVAGVSWDVSIMTAKIGSDDGGITTDAIVKAIKYAENNGAEIANCSWGMYSVDPLVRDHIAASRMLFVCASGNDGFDNDGGFPMYPASYPLSNILAVASSSPADGLSEFSNYGATAVDLAAPGEDILSTFPTADHLALFKEDFHSLSRWDTSDYWQKPWALSGEQYLVPSFSLAQASPKPSEWAWATLKEPIDLAGAERIWITLEVRSEMVKEDDYLWLGNGSGLGQLVRLHTGPTDGWQTVGLLATDIPAGSQLRMALVYGSDTARSKPPGRVYVDNVRVYKEEPYAPWAFMGGTSMAAPHAAGTAALVKSRNSILTAEQVKDVLMASVDPRDGLTGKMVTGGRLNAASAVAATPAPTKTVSVKRIAGKDRYDVSALIAKQVFYDDDMSWTGTKDVIIASGDDRAAADPLSAAGLSWALDAPVLLVGAQHTPAAVQSTIKQITAANGGVRVHVVGGENSVPSGRLNDVLAPAKSAGSVAVVKRYGAGIDRFGVAAQVSAAVRAEWQSRSGKNPPVALAANGADSNTFFDALALSSISAKKGFPILLVESDRVPSVTAGELSRIKPENVYAAGGYRTVSYETLKQLDALSTKGAVRWGGKSRYDTAIVIADEAADNGWLHTNQAMVTAKLPDALTGGSMLGRSGVPLLVTDSDELPRPADLYLIDMARDMDRCFILGGTASVNRDVEMRVRSILQ